MMKRLLKTRKGSSLVEVLISFVLIGVIILMVGGAVTSAYKTATVLQKYPAVYYKGQEAVENELDYLNKKITRKYLCEKELGTLVNPDPALAEELNGINEELEEGREKVTVTLFGKNVTVYQFEKDCSIDSVGNVLLYAGTASGVRLERPVPVIDSVTANIVGQVPAGSYYNAVGSTIVTEVNYADTNADYRYSELYQWYVSSGDQRTVWYDDGTPGPNELQHGSLLPVYPGNFTLITSERTSSIVVTEEYKGKFLFCLVTPLSINGKMGDSVMSTPIYIDALPEGLNYRAVIDPSLMTLTYSADGKAKPANFESTGAASGYFSRKEGEPYIDLNGTVISEDKDALTRFIHFELRQKLQASSSLRSKTGDVVFAVVRTELTLGQDFLEAGRKYGFLTNESITDPNLGGWRLIRMRISDKDKTYILSNAQYDLAELIIVSNPGDEGEARITEYLTNKYGIV